MLFENLFELKNNLFARYCFWCFKKFLLKVKHKSKTILFVEVDWCFVPSRDSRPFEMSNNT